MKSPPSYQESRNQLKATNEMSQSSPSNVNFKQYFVNLKHAKKRDTPMQESICSYEDLSNTSSSSHSQTPLYTNQVEQQKRHKLIKFSNSNSKLTATAAAAEEQCLQTNYSNKKPIKFTSEIEKELSNLTLSIEKEMEKQKLQKQLKQQTTNNEIYANCFKCNKAILSRDDAVLAMSNVYHNACFVCIACGRQLRGKSFYHLSNNQVYCEEDYLYSGFLENAEKCNVCGHIIVDMILQAMGKSYHPGCFRCFSCNECLDGVAFALDVNNRAYCINDYFRIYAPKCASCGLAITPMEGTNETVRVVSMEKDFHLECYACEDCGLQLSDEQDKRCYPLGKCLLCYSCHVKRIELNQLDQMLLNNLSSSSSSLSSSSNQLNSNHKQQASSFMSSTPSSNQNRSIGNNYHPYHFQMLNQQAEYANMLNNSKKHLQTENL